MIDEFNSRMETFNVTAKATLDEVNARPIAEYLDTVIQKK